MTETEPLSLEAKAIGPWIALIAAWLAALAIMNVWTIVQMRRAVTRLQDAYEPISDALWFSMSVNGASILLKIILAVVAAKLLCTRFKASTVWLAIAAAWLCGAVPTILWRLAHGESGLSVPTAPTAYLALDLGPPLAVSAYLLLSARVATLYGSQTSASIFSNTRRYWTRARSRTNDVSDIFE